MMAKFLFFLLLIPTYLISLLPLRVHYVISDFIAFLLGKIVKYRSYVIYINLARSFPSLKYGDIKRIAGEYYKYMSDVIVETIWSISSSSKRLAKLGEIENPEVLREIYDSGRSALVVLGHQGNWEYLGAVDAFAKRDALGFTMSNIGIAYKKVENGTFDYLTNFIRTRHGLKNLIESNDMARFMIKNRDNQMCYFLISDQSPLPGSRFVVDFMHQQTLMINGPEQLSKMLNLPVVYLNINRERRGCYKMTLTKISDNPKGEEPGFITERYASLLEEGIKANPNCWLWSHKRWKRGIEESKVSKQ